MTKNEAAAIRLRWEQRAYDIPCEHLTLELERNDRGDTTGKYICILCGESVAQRNLAA
jgi:rubrerythrin